MKFKTDDLIVGFIGNIQLEDVAKPLQKMNTHEKTEY